MCSIASIGSFFTEGVPSANANGFNVALAASDHPCELCIGANDAQLLVKVNLCDMMLRVDGVGHLRNNSH